MHTSKVLSGMLFFTTLLAPAACKQNVAPEPEGRQTSALETGKKAQTTGEKATQSEGTQDKGSATDPASVQGKSAVGSDSKQPAPALARAKVSAKPVASVEVAPGDPHKGSFTLAEATKGIAGSGKLIAEMDTELGLLSCELYEDKAPITVANFVGLARGTRAWKDNGQWVNKPLYDGTVFHRVVKGFMIQGGDPAGNGSGGPGFVIPDEIWEDAHHDERGQLCMANRGPNTNGSQFFIMDGKAAHLDGGYTIFGKCAPDEVIEKLASTPVRGQSAITPPKIKSVTFKRQP